MNSRGFMISIPQIVSGGIAMFVAILGLRIVYPIISPILALSWDNTGVKTGAQIAIYLVIAFLVYIVVYGTITGRKPNILGSNNVEGGESNAY